MSKIYGYARCSLAEEKGQDLNRQVRELKAAGAEEIITEREHGDSKVKQNLDLLLEVAAASHVRRGRAGRFHHRSGSLPHCQKHTTAL